jgi:CheY-like chemotaxis protein
MKATRILIVDDCRDNSLLLATILKKSGFDVHSISQPEMLRSAMHQMAPEVVLMDLAMPGMNGLQAARLLRTEGYAGPLIAVTGYADDEHRRQAHEAGFDLYLVKPVDISDLLRALAEQSCKI